MLTAGVEAMHASGLVFRDLHPTRIHLCEGIAKWNLIGMPYNFKKLLKGEGFTGHLNYTAPEVLNDGELMSPKVDIWALGCCLHFLITKRDPFTCDNPKTNTAVIKKNIETGVECIDTTQFYNLDWKGYPRHAIIQSLLEVCLKLTPEERPTATELLVIIDDEVAKYESVLRKIQADKQEE